MGIFDQNLDNSSRALEIFNKRCLENNFPNFIEIYKHRHIPDNVGTYDDFYKYTIGCNNNNYDLEDMSIGFYLRNECVFNCGFSLVYYKWIDQLIISMKDYIKSINKDFNNIKVLEVCAGLGAISYALQHRGIKTYTTDLFKDTIIFKNYKNKYCDIENLDMVDAVNKYIKDIDFIICSWPRDELDDKMIEIMNIIHDVKPEVIFIYIGEGITGCCSGYVFFENTIDDDRINLDNVNDNYIRWHGIYDSIFAFRLK